MGSYQRWKRNFASSKVLWVLMQNKGIVTKVNCGTTVYFNAQSLHPVFAISSNKAALMVARVMKLSIRSWQCISNELAPWRKIVVSWRVAAAFFFFFSNSLMEQRIKSAIKDRWVPVEEGNKSKLAEQVDSLLGCGGYLRERDLCSLYSFPSLSLSISLWLDKRTLEIQWTLAGRIAIRSCRNTFQNASAPRASFRCRQAASNVSRPRCLVSPIEAMWECYIVIFAIWQCCSRLRRAAVRIKSSQAQITLLPNHLRN